MTIHMRMKAYQSTADLRSTSLSKEVSDHLISSSTQVISARQILVVAGFLGRKYCYEPIAIQTPGDYGWSLIPYIRHIVLFQTTFSFCFSLNIADSGLHLYNTIDKIIITLFTI